MKTAVVLCVVEVTAGLVCKQAGQCAFFHFSEPHAGKQAFPVIISQRGNRNVEHFGNLTDRIHKIAPHIFINEA